MHVIYIETNKLFSVFRNPVCYGFYVVSEMNIILQSGYYESPLGYDNVDWLADEVIKLENNMDFFRTLKKTLA